MLRRNPQRSRDRGERLHALALAARKKASAVMAKRPHSVAMADNFVQAPYKGGKTRFTLLQNQAIHIRDPVPMRESPS